MTNIVRRTTFHNTAREVAPRVTVPIFRVRDQELSSYFYRALDNTCCRDKYYSSAKQNIYNACKGIGDPHRALGPLAWRHPCLAPRESRQSRHVMPTAPDGILPGPSTWEKPPNRPVPGARALLAPTRAGSPGLGASDSRYTGFARHSRTSTACRQVIGLQAWSWH